MKLSLVVFILYFMPFHVFANCTAVISLPLSMTGTQTQLQWTGTIGGSGRGNAISTCPTTTAYSHDYRYNIIETEAQCVNSLTHKSYSAPVTSLGANLASGALEKVGSQSSGGRQYDIWGNMINTQTTGLPTTGDYGGMYNTRASIDFSSLPAGNYVCSVRNNHGVYGTNNSSELVKGATDLFNYSIAQNAWASGNVSITINATCAVQNSLTLDHGSVLTGTNNTKQESLNITCNRDNTIKLDLQANSDASDAVLVNLGGIGGSESRLSVSGDGQSFDKTITVDVLSNIPSSIYFRSELSAKGSGMQSGNAIAQIIYD